MKKLSNRRMSRISLFYVLRKQLSHVFLYHTDKIKLLWIFCLFMKFGVKDCREHLSLICFPHSLSFFNLNTLTVKPEGEALQDCQTPTWSWMSEVRSHGRGLVPTSGNPKTNQFVTVTDSDMTHRLISRY